MKKILNSKFNILNSCGSNGGFVTLVSVLIASILLAMALSISNVAYKEQLLSINARSSQYSFIAADSGMECALLYDIKYVVFPNDGTNNPSDPILCGDQSLVSLSSNPIYKLEVVAENGSGVIVDGCAIFSINKLYTNRLGESGTKIESRGYNVACDDITIDPIGNITFLNGVGPRAVERLLTAEYVYISTGTGT